MRNPSKKSRAAHLPTVQSRSKLQIYHQNGWNSSISVNISLFLTFFFFRVVDNYADEFLINPEHQDYISSDSSNAHEFEDDNLCVPAKKGN